MTYNNDYNGQQQIIQLKTIIIRYNVLILKNFFDFKFISAKYILFQIKLFTVKSFKKN